MLCTLTLKGLLFVTLLRKIMLIFIPFPKASHPVLLQKCPLLETNPLPSFKNSFHILKIPAHFLNTFETVIEIYSLPPKKKIIKTRDKISFQPTIHKCVPGRREGMPGRMCRIPVGLNERAFLPRAFSTLIHLRFQLLRHLYSAA